MHRLTIITLVLFSYTGISLGTIGKAMFTPFHLVMGILIGYGILAGRKNSNYTLSSLVILTLYLTGINIWHYPNIRFTTILYTIIFALELTVLYNLFRRSLPKTVLIAFKIILYTYAVNLFLGNILILGGVSDSFVTEIIRVYYAQGDHMGRPMGFSTEPSYAAFILSVVFLSFSHLRKHRWDNEMVKFTVVYLLCISLSKSAYGFIFVGVNLLDWGIQIFQRGSRQLRNLFPFIGIFVIMIIVAFIQNSSNEAAVRLTNVSEVLFDPTLDAAKRMKKLQEVDGSAFSRIAPSYILFNKENRKNINLWAGQGAGTSGVDIAQFMEGITVEEGTAKMDTGIIPAFIYDYGFVGLMLLVVFLFFCFRKLSISFWIMFLLILPNANINTQLFWFAIACYLFVALHKEAAPFRSSKRTLQLTVQS